MKKPSIDDIWIDMPTSAPYINGSKPVDADTINDMIDALIESERLISICRDRLNPSHYSDFINELDECQENNYKALLKAGCE